METHRYDERSKGIMTVFIGLIIALVLSKLIPDVKTKNGLKQAFTRQGK